MNAKYKLGSCTLFVKFHDINFQLVVFVTLLVESPFVQNANCWCSECAISVLFFVVY